MNRRKSTLCYISVSINFLDIPSFVPKPSIDLVNNTARRIFDGNFILSDYSHLIRINSRLKIKNFLSLSLDLKEGMMVGDLFSLAFAVDKSIRFKKVFWFDFLHLHDSNGFITEVGVLNGEIVIRPEFINRIIRKKLEGV